MPNDVIQGNSIYAHECEILIKDKVKLVPKPATQLLTFTYIINEDGLLRVKVSQEDGTELSALEVSRETLNIPREEFTAMC